MNGAEAKMTCKSRETGLALMPRVTLPLLLQQETAEALIGAHR